jgi:hypothetical protein
MRFLGGISRSAPAWREACSTTTTIDYWHPNRGHGGVYYGGRPITLGNTFVLRAALRRRVPARRRTTAHRRTYANRYNNNYNRNNKHQPQHQHSWNNNNYMELFDKNRTVCRLQPRSHLATQNARNDSPRSEHLHRRRQASRATTGEHATAGQRAAPGTSQWRPMRRIDRPRVRTRRPAVIRAPNRTSQCDAAPNAHGNRRPLPNDPAQGGQGLPKTTGHPAGRFIRDAEPTVYPSASVTQRGRRRRAASGTRPQQHEIRAAPTTARAAQDARRCRAAGRRRPAIITRGGETTMNSTKRLAISVLATRRTRCCYLLLWRLLCPAAEDEPAAPNLPDCRSSRDALGRGGAAAEDSHALITYWERSAEALVSDRGTTSPTPMRARGSVDHTTRRTNSSPTLPEQIHR